jgi:hypothetical protein
MYLFKKLGQPFLASLLKQANGRETRSTGANTVDGVRFMDASNRDDWNSNRAANFPKPIETLGRPVSSLRRGVEHGAEEDVACSIPFGVVRGLHRVAGNANLKLRRRMASPAPTHDVGGSKRVAAEMNSRRVGSKSDVQPIVQINPGRRAICHRLLRRRNSIACQGEQFAAGKVLLANLYPIDAGIDRQANSFREICERTG